MNCLSCNSSLELEKSEFLLGSVINAVVSQVMTLLRERGLQLIRDIPEEIKTLCVYGDQLRIQQVLADFLLNMVRCAPSPDGWLEIHVLPSLKQTSGSLSLMHVEFRYGSVHVSLDVFGWRLKWMWGLKSVSQKFVSFVSLVRKKMILT